jgi:nucleoside diphosphate kinase
MLRQIDLSPKGDNLYTYPLEPEDVCMPVIDHVAFSYIKSGFEDCHESIVGDLNEHGLYPVHTERLTLQPDVVDYIYHGARGKHFYEVMKQHLTQTSVLAMIIEGHGSKTQESVTSLKKGENGFPNLREKYAKNHGVTDEEMVLWQRGEHPNQNGLTIILTQKNVLHSADDSEDAVESIRMIFGEQMLVALAKGRVVSAHSTS